MAKNTKTSKHVAPAQLARVSPETPASGIFFKRSQVKATGKVIVKSMSPILKPINWPKIDGQNVVVVGIFTKVVPLSEFTEGQGKDEKTRQGYGVEIVPEGAPVGIVLPLVATLKTGLDITLDDATRSGTSMALGKTVEIELLPERIPSKKGQAAWHFIVAIHDQAPTLALN